MSVCYYYSSHPLHPLQTLGPAARASQHRRHFGGNLQALTADVAGKVGRKVVDVDENTRLVRFNVSASEADYVLSSRAYFSVGAREAHEQARTAAPAVDDVDLVATWGALANDCASISRVLT
jgi:hypothetical protein